MTILDKLFGDDPPKKKPISASQVIWDKAAELGVNQNAFEGLLKIASGYSNPVKKVEWTNPDTGQTGWRFAGSYSPSGMTKDTNVQRGRDVDGNYFWYLKMKDEQNNEFPYKISKYNEPELFDILERGINITPEQINTLMGKIGGTSNTPGGSPYGFANGVDGGGLHDYSFKKVNADMNIGPIEIPQYKGTIEPFKENEPFEPYYPTMRPYNVTIRPPLVRPFELKEFDDGITIRKRRSLFDMISNFPFLGTEPVKGIKGI